MKVLILHVEKALDCPEADVYFRTKGILKRTQAQTGMTGWPRDVANSMFVRNAMLNIEGATPYVGLRADRQSSYRRFAQQNKLRKQVLRGRRATRIGCVRL